jgi:NADPH:quinone reductase-like Zn-dependent oxidoreductase
VGGTETLENSLAAIRHGGHINIIGYVTGANLGITVFPLIIKNADFHGIGTGNRDSYEAMMAAITASSIRPTIDRAYAFEETGRALADLDAGGHFGKLVVNIP